MIANHGEAALFRRFDTLNVKSLLYMQAELVHLEAELRQVEERDRVSTDPSKGQFPFSVYDLKESGAGVGKITQWSKYQELQSKIQKYNGALLQYLSLRKVARPTLQEINFLREWLDRPEGGDFFLKGREADIWESQQDLLSLDAHQTGQDSLTWLINKKIVQWYHSRWGSRAKAPSTGEWYGVYEYKKHKLSAIANVISTLLASLLPSVSILTLYLLEKPITRLITILLFSVLFSSILTCVSITRRIEVFAATTAAGCLCLRRRILLILSQGTADKARDSQVNDRDGRSTLNSGLSHPTQVAFNTEAVRQLILVPEVQTPICLLINRAASVGVCLGSSGIFEGYQALAVPGVVLEAKNIEQEAIWKRLSDKSGSGGDQTGNVMILPIQSRRVTRYSLSADIGNSATNAQFSTTCLMAIHLPGGGKFIHPAKLDTGASRNLLRRKFALSIGLPITGYDGPPLKPIGSLHRLDPIGEVGFEWRVSGRHTEYLSYFAVLQDDDCRGLNFDIALCEDEMKRIGFYNDNHDVFMIGDVGG
ncbi:MAG: hypothetical protein Q9220_000453 [cf. Caloplaca sp. 1 TL-2023]